MLIGGALGAFILISYFYELLHETLAYCAYVYLLFYAWLVIIKKGENVGTLVSLQVPHLVLMIPNLVVLMISLSDLL